MRVMRVLVTAGPTREAIDPVRFISNRSSGRMGYAVASAFVARKHRVCLVSGPVCLPPVKGAKLIKVTTALEMLKAVRRNIAWCDVLVMAAAVADWRPARPSARKMKKSAGRPALKLEPTDDILQSVKRLKGKRIFVGFAAETENTVKEAAGKLERKGLDLIVANNVLEPDAGFEAETNRVILVANGRIEKWPLMTKKAVARKLAVRIESIAGEAR